MKRPLLTDALTAEEFLAWYWLKAEMVDFCRRNGVSPSGSKLEIQHRIVERLKRQADPSVGHAAAILAKPSRPTRSVAPMPLEFNLDMTIGRGWRCGPALGAFLRKEFGTGFRFNAAVREFIHQGEGRRLGDVIFCYRESVKPDAEKREIPAQLEYNRHFRAYFQQNPGATRAEAIEAWWAKRNSRKTDLRGHGRG